MAKGIVAIVVGYLVFALSAVALFAFSGHDPHAPVSRGFLALSILYGIFFAGLAGYVAAWIGKTNDLRYVLPVAIIIALGALVSLLANPGAGAIWSQISTLLLMSPAALIGGYLRLEQSRRSAHL